jgi:hypothetical protein
VRCRPAATGATFVWHQACSNHLHAATGFALMFATRCSLVSWCELVQVVSEKLSHHIIQNYDKFVDGVNEVIHVEEDLQARRRDCLALSSLCTGLSAFGSLEPTPSLPHAADATAAVTIAWVTAGSHQADRIMG